MYESYETVVVPVLVILAATCQPIVVPGISASDLVALSELNTAAVRSVDRMRRLSSTLLVNKPAGISFALPPETSTPLACRVRFPK